MAIGAGPWTAAYSFSIRSISAPVFALKIEVSSPFPHAAVSGETKAGMNVMVKSCAKEGAELFIPPLSLCTDNAAMATLAVEKWKIGQFAGHELEAEPNWL